MGDIPSRCSMIAGTMTLMSLVVDGKLLFNLGWCGVECDGGCRKLWLTKDFNVREISRTMKEAVLEKVDVEMDWLVATNRRWKVVVEVLKCTKGTVEWNCTQEGRYNGRTRYCQRRGAR
jgi:hypothetical protein